MIRSLEQLPSNVKGSVLAIGNFDGVHLGHRVLISELLTMARRHGAPAMIFTFDPPPMRLLRPEPWPSPLTWMERRVELLTDLGIEHVIAYPTTPELLDLDAESFFRKILIEELGIRGMVEGPNFRFGRDRGGDIAMLGRLCRDHHLDFSVVEPQRIDNEWVSSSSIREAIEAGEIARANQALGAPYRLRGIVEPGVGRGRKIGFPTANLGAIPVLVPARGVYAGRVVRAQWNDGRSAPETLWRSPAAIHIGPNPTFGEDSDKVEIHLIGFAGDLYGAKLEVEIVRRIRSVIRFAGLDELLLQIQRDLQAVTMALSE
jgi:riboflavin kinase/FMN adenylyltransferase